MTTLDYELADAARDIARLFDTWPSDGWDGAAAIIAAHDQRYQAAKKHMMAICEKLKLTGRA